MNFIDRTVSVEQAIIILAKNGVQVNEKEAKDILELLYLVAKTYNKSKEKKALTLRRIRTLNDCRLQAYCGTFRLFISNRLSILRLKHRTQKVKF
ncbi:hypothetical protein OWR28_15720 [Chryseobacterium sp. 1B4]